jgi:hypothetical protein
MKEDCRSKIESGEDEAGTKLGGVVPSELKERWMGWRSDRSADGCLGDRPQGEGLREGLRERVRAWGCLREREAGES